MFSIQDLQSFVIEPREALDAEYKDWLDLSTNKHKATIAKAAIALVNHGGGYIVIGFSENNDELRSIPQPENIPIITQDLINACIRRYATPEFHCEMYSVPHSETGVIHPVIVIPRTLTEPVMSRRDCQGIISKNRCYIRKPGPRSEEPHTGEEWRGLLQRCIRAGRDDMLEAIRTIVSGRIETQNSIPNVFDELQMFSEAAYSRWKMLIENEPENSPAQFPHGYYEMGFSLVHAEPASGLSELQERLATARRIRLTGWTPFLEMNKQEWKPYPYEDFVEAWVGRPVQEDRMYREPAHCDFWRVSPEGKLYTIRGYMEDGWDSYSPGQVFDIILPIWRIGEGILFASRLAQTYESVESIAIYCRFVGLDGRYLTSLNGRRHLSGDYVSSTDECILTVQATTSQIQDNLAEILHPLLVPLYERFNFFPLSFVLVEEELGRLRKGKF